MAATLAVTVLFSMFALASTAPGTPTGSDTTRADTTQPSPRIVRRFPIIEVRAPLHDLRSSQTVRVIPGAALRTLPVDDLADAIALQAGVVAQGEGLHVRGGRSGETAILLDGLSLNEPLRRRALEVPMLALRSADLVSGTPEAQYGSGLAGTLDLRTVDPGQRFSGDWRWQSDGGPEGDRYDRVSGRVEAPLHLLGLGVMAAGDATLDDTWLPNLRTGRDRRVVGLPVGWRAENRMLGYLKLAPVEAPRRFSVELLAGRQVHRPYDPAWSLDGWTDLYPIDGQYPLFRPDPARGFQRYRAADHLAITDDRQMAALVSVSTLSVSRRGTLSLGWLRTRTVTSAGGRKDAGYLYDSYDDPFLYGFAKDPTTGPFYLIWGDYPLYRESGSDVLSLRGDGEIAMRSGNSVKAGAGMTLEHVSLYELDGASFRQGLDSLRTYDANAPGAFAYVQGRWSHAGLVMNTGLRAEYFTAGSEGERQTLPGNAHGLWSFSPRLGFAYPVSVRDVFSLAYVRVQQDPGRDFLYDRRRLITTRQPLGNPALVPATVISYEAAVKHLFSAEWALQGALFFRDIWGQIGARNYDLTVRNYSLTVQRYTNDDEAQAEGFECSLLYGSGNGRRFEAHYTWMKAWGSESRPEGDPYGRSRGDRIAPIADVPLSWDRHHTFLLSGALPFRRSWSVSWTTAVGSPLPWTPKERGEPLTDVGAVNSRRLQWTETTNLDLRWSPRPANWLTLALETRNLFDRRGERYVSVDGYPNPAINTYYDDYGAYRTETGQGGGAYWRSGEDGGGARWVPVNDPRLLYPPRSVRFSVDVKW